MPNNAREILREAGCILEGNYFFALKKHGLLSKKYVNLDPLLTNPGSLYAISSMLMLRHFGDFNCVVGPAVGAIPLAYLTAIHAVRQLERQGGDSDITTAFAEKAGDGFKFDRMGFATAVRGRRVLIVEDIASTGDTTKAVIELVRQCGGEVVGVSMIWNRGNITAEMLGVPLLTALVNESIETLPVEDNPSDWGVLPLVANVGHPEYYPNYPGGRITLAL